MKKGAVYLILFALLCSMGVPAIAESENLPYTQMDEQGMYGELPPAGSAANGEVIFDDERVTITVLDCRYEEETPQYDVDLQIENHSGEALNVSGSLDAIVDGFAFDAFLSEDLEAGEQKDTTLYILAEDFHKAGIATPQEIKFNLSFFQQETIEYLDTAYFAIYPSGIAPEDVVYTAMEEIGYPTMEYYSVTTGCNFRIIDGKLQENGEFYQIDLVVENCSDAHKVFSWKNVKVNGVPTEPYWFCGVPAGSKRIEYVYLDMAELAKSGVQEVNTLEFSYTIDDAMETLLMERIRLPMPKG